MGRCPREFVYNTHRISDLVYYMLSLSCEYFVVQIRDGSLVGPFSGLAGKFISNQFIELALVTSDNLYDCTSFCNSYGYWKNTLYIINFITL